MRKISLTRLLDRYLQGKSSKRELRFLFNYYEYFQRERSQHDLPAPERYTRYTIQLKP